MHSYSFSYIIMWNMHYRQRQADFIQMHLSYLYIPREGEFFKHLLNERKILKAYGLYLGIFHKVIKVEDIKGVCYSKKSIERQTI